MNDRCSFWRESICESLSGPLPEERAKELERHVAECAACRRYAEALAGDDRLLVDFAEKTAPVVAEIERTVMEAIGEREPAGSRGHLGVRLWRVAAAAAIVGGLAAVLGRLLLPLGGPSVMLAQTLQNMREAPWVHVVQTLGAEEAQRYEYWERAGGDVLVQKRPDGRITYADYNENVMYAYNPVANRITVSFTTDSYRVAPLWDPLVALSKAIERTEPEQVQVMVRVDGGSGVRTERIETEYECEAGRVFATYIRDTGRNRLLREDTIVVGTEGESSYTTVYDYPEEGPGDLYDLGVPRDAAILDIRPEGAALDLIDAVQERFERGFGDHRAVVLESRVDPDGASHPGQIAVLWQKGEMKRCDVYRAFDSRRRANGVGSLYPVVKDVWGDLTIAEVLEIGDVNALTLRLLFDGQRTIRWRNEGGQLVQDEHRTDLFALPYGPLPHSLAGLIWSSPHLRLQSGSSQFKRELRLLPEDPNRPGLVGLQLVEFAARENCWFDPDRDYMLIERVRKEEGRGVTSRWAALRPAQASENRWYPELVRIESASLDDAVAGGVSARELRIQVDGNASFDDGVFGVEAQAATEAVDSNMPAEAESTAETEAEQVAADVGQDGTVRDAQGQAVEGATVLLYHRRNTRGLGNRVVETMQTGPAGQYVLRSPIRFERLVSHAYGQDTYVVLALHPDYAFGWRILRPGEEEGNYDVTLTAPRSRSILVTDHDGSPLPGARVWLYHAGDRSSANPVFRDSVSLPTDIGVLGAVADANGMALITNLPDTGCSFRATLDGYAQELAFSGQNHIRLSPGGSVAGWVLTESGEPVSGAVVRLKTGWMHNYFLAESDEQGHFALTGLPAEGWDMSPWGIQESGTGQYTMTVRHERHAGADRELHLLPGQRIDEMIVEVSSEATLVRCLVVDEATGQVVSGARIRGENAIGEIHGYSDANGVEPVRLILGSTENAIVLLEDEDGNTLVDRSICIRPKVADEIQWSAERVATTDSLGVLEVDGVVPGLTYFLRDAKFDEAGGRHPEGWEQWFKREMVLVPGER